MAITEGRIRELGAMYLSDEGIEILEELLIEDKLEGSTYMLLGAFDRLWKDGKLGEEEARSLYAELGISPEKSSGVRQRNLKF